MGNILGNDVFGKEKDVERNTKWMDIMALGPEDGKWKQLAEF